VLRAVTTFEAKALHANVHTKDTATAKKADGTAEIALHRGDATTSTSEHTTKTDVMKTDASGSTTTSDDEDEALDARYSAMTSDQLLAHVKERLLYIESHIERRYLKSFHSGLAILPETVLGNVVESSTAVVNGSTSPPDEQAPDLVRWRDGVHSSGNSAQLMLCLIQLDANIAWERSVMRAQCQICRSGDNEGQLLLCDYCDMGFHTYCFKVLTAMM